jgi:hypothetical protein
VIDIRNSSNTRRIIIMRVRKSRSGHFSAIVNGIRSSSQDSGGRTSSGVVLERTNATTRRH